MNTDRLHVVCEEKLKAYQEDAKTVTREQLRADAIEMYWLLQRFPMFEDVCNLFLRLSVLPDITADRLEAVIIEALVEMHISLN